MEAEDLDSDSLKPSIPEYLGKCLRMPWDTHSLIYFYFLFLKKFIVV